MTEKIRHRRLYAFYDSYLLNCLSILLFAALLLSCIAPSIYLPCIIAACITFIAGIIYSLWLWISRPASIMICKWISTIASDLTLYFLIYVAWRPESVWFAIVPAACGLLAILISLLKHSATPFLIKTEEDNAGHAASGTAR